MKRSTNQNHDTRVCFLTGASKRLGACTAKKFHAEGFNVIIHYNSSKDEAHALVAQLNALRIGSAFCLQADLSNREQMQPLAQLAFDCYQRVDVLVNNASAFYPTPLTECDHKAWDDLFDSNLRAAFFLAQQLAPELKLRAGSVINMTDTHADNPLKGFPIYSMAKAGVKAMTKSLAKELAPRVRVNGVSPGAILWPPSLEDESDPAILEARKNMLEKIPLRTLGEPQNIADTVFFLANDACYVTGQTVRVDGGRYLS
ncbi:MAG: pteridine reductase [SAR86 cluster bacterium]|uniref:Pteridine reductase n=1 Tax=SAR86 cluster bacterium TaxID=2030880 RepID=A0A2A4X2H2_9GAMM|nr:MAG: pteridine reductase [SAR86 cluster bacterium]